MFAWHRVLVYEVNMMGWQFAAMRMGSSLLLPLIAAGMTAALCESTGLR